MLKRNRVATEKDTIIILKVSAGHKEKNCTPGWTGTNSMHVLLITGNILEILILNYYYCIVSLS